MRVSTFTTSPGDLLGPPRWRGQPGRLEVWYLTLTDPATGTGCWIHHEIVSPPDERDSYAHGWIALFPPDAPPVHKRFGPEKLSPGGWPARPNASDAWFDAAGALAAPGRLAGSTAGAAWQLTFEDRAEPLWTFPRWAWEREVLPAAQIVSHPSAVISGEVTVAGRRVQVEGAKGAVARIYGHGNAERWAWLHADLGGKDVVEVVNAVSRRAGLQALPPLAFVRLRVGGCDRPRAPFAVGRSSIGPSSWSLSGIAGAHRIRIQAELPPARAVALRYEDPDGATATCTNTEAGHAEIVLERWRGRWSTEHAWNVRGTAHTEVGMRP